MCTLSCVSIFRFVSRSPSVRFCGGRVTFYAPTEHDMTYCTRTGSSTRGDMDLWIYGPPDVSNGGDCGPFCTPLVLHASILLIACARRLQSMTYEQF